jgi:predicted transcriptional regulator of viral defense system
MPDEECVDRHIDGKRTPRLSETDEDRPTAVDRIIGELASRQSGVVARWQLAQRGIDRGAIEGRVARGALHVLHRGVYAVGHLALTRDGRWMAAVLACGPDAVLSHRSAGQLWGLVPRSAMTPEVTRPGYCRRRRGMVIHRSVIPADETDIVDGIPVTSPHRTILDLAAVLRRRELERALNEAEVRDVTDRLSLPELMELYPRRRGAAILKKLLAAKTPGGSTVNDSRRASSLSSTPTACRGHASTPRCRFAAACSRSTACGANSD